MEDKNKFSSTFFPNVVIEENIVNELLRLISDVTGREIDHKDIECGFFSIGLDSLSILQLSENLSSFFHIEISPTTFFEYPNIISFTKFIISTINPTNRVSQPITNLNPSSDDATEVRDISEKEIAVVGYSCRFGGRIRNPQSFWDVMRNGEEVLQETPSERWVTSKYESIYGGKFPTAGYIQDLGISDPSFFKIGESEMKFLDPAHLLLLEGVWEALESGGITPSSLHGSNTSVYVGSTYHEFNQLVHSHQESDMGKSLSTWVTGGTGHSVLSGRINYIFGFNGEALTVDTACSSSAMAVTLGMNRLISKKSRMAIAGGVNLFLTPWNTINFGTSGFLSSKGQCKTFDISADGYARGEGVGVLVLKLLTDAIADGNRILGLLSGKR